MKADPPAPRPPAQEASSSNRAPRAAEVDPRAQYRRFPNEMRVAYSANNPARIDSERYKSYDNYKTATTIGEARVLGATSQDITLDLSAGAVRIIRNSNADNIAAYRNASFGIVLWYWLRRQSFGGQRVDGRLSR